MYLMNGKHYQTIGALIDDVVLDFDNEIDYDLDAPDNLPQPPTTNETEGLQRCDVKLATPFWKTARRSEKTPTVNSSTYAQSA